MNRLIHRLAEGDAQPKLPLPLNDEMSSEEIGRKLTLRPDRVQSILDASDILPPRAVAKAFGVAEDVVREIMRLAGR